MIENGKTLNAYDLCVYLDTVDPYYFYEPQYGDREYDYGYANDGWPRPGPCIVCGAPDWTCIHDYYAVQARLSLPPEERSND